MLDGYAERELVLVWRAARPVVLLLHESVLVHGDRGAVGVLTKIDNGGGKRKDLGGSREDKCGLRK